MHVFKASGLRSRTLGPAALCAVLAIAGLLAAAGPAGALPSTRLTYSTDGGTTWVEDPTVGPGATVLVRAWYDNDTSGAIPAVTLATSLPDGFSLVPSSTRTCLAPDTTDPLAPTGDLVCSTDSGQLGEALDDSAIWSGQDLAVGPTAGLFGQTGDLTQSTIDLGKRHYLNLQQCTYASTATPVDRFSTTVPTSAPYAAGTNASNTADASADCGPGTPGRPLEAGGVSALDLLGQSQLNLDQCSYHDFSSPHEYWVTLVSDGNVIGNLFAAGTNVSNTADETPGCGAGTTGRVPDTGLTGTEALSLLGRRYLNLNQCSYATTNTPAEFFTTFNGTGTAYAAGSATGLDPASSPTCGAGTPGRPAEPGLTGVGVIDLLDPTRGAGFVELEVVAPSPATTTQYPMSGTVTTGAGGTVLADSATITVDVAVVPLVSWPVVGGLLALVVAAWFAGARLLRTRRQQRYPLARA